MASRDIVVIGTSAGGIRALQQLVSGLPAAFPAALFVVMHTSPGPKSMLPEILSRAGPLPAVAAEDGAPFENGRIFVAPSNRHLLLEPGRMRVVFSPRVNLFRPAIDPLFHSAASAYGPRVIGILLSGALDDGCDGLVEISRRGGLTLAQEPSDAEFPQLPLNAIRTGRVNHVLPARELPALLVNEVTMRDVMLEEVTKPVTGEAISVRSDPPDRHFDGITCPDCHGPIYEDHASGLRFRCVAGHSYTPETMRLEHAKKLENALWSAIANFEEHAAILRRLARTANEDRAQVSAGDLEDEALQQDQNARELRAFIEKVNRVPA